MLIYHSWKLLSWFLMTFYGWDVEILIVLCTFDLSYDNWNGKITFNIRKSRNLRATAHTHRCEFVGCCWKSLSCRILLQAEHCTDCWGVLYHLVWTDSFNSNYTRSTEINFFIIRMRYEVPTEGHVVVNAQFFLLVVPFVPLSCTDISVLVLPGQSSRLVDRPSNSELKSTSQNSENR